MALTVVVRSGEATTPPQISFDSPRVVIGRGDGREFDWEPTLTSAAELITSPRGTDARLDDNRRATRSQRREEYFERMDAKAAARAELEAEREAGMWHDEPTSKEDEQQ